MIDLALEKLRARFEPLEWDLMSRDPAVKLGERPALVIEFSGKVRDRGVMIGACVMTKADGVGYWFFTWGPADKKEAVFAQSAKVRELFAYSSL